MKLTCKYGCTCALIKKLLINVEIKLEQFFLNKSIKIRDNLCDELSCVFMHYMITRSTSINEIEFYYAEIEFQFFEYLKHFKQTLKISYEIACEYFLNNFNPHEEGTNWNIKDIILKLFETETYDCLISDIVEDLCFTIHHKYNIKKLLDINFLNKCIEQSFSNIDEIELENFKSKKTNLNFKNLNLQMTHNNPRVATVSPNTTINDNSDYSDDDM